MNLSDEEREAIISEIHEFHDAPRLEPGEFTVAQYAESAEEPMTPSQAAGQLRKLVARGVLERREVLHEGKWKGAYSKATGSVVASGNGASSGG